MPYKQLIIKWKNLKYVLVCFGFDARANWLVQLKIV